MPLYQLLKNPDDGPLTAGGSATDGLVTISREELDALRAIAGAAAVDGKSQTDAAREGREEAEVAGRAREAAHAGELAERDRKVAEWERAFRRALRDRDLATALVDRQLVAGAAPQLIRLWSEEFDVFEDGGEFKVADRQGRTVGQAVAERLASPEYAHFCRPSSRGGTASAGTNTLARPAAAPAPKTLGEAALMRWQEAATRGNPASAPIGLGKRR